MEQTLRLTAFGPVSGRCEALVLAAAEALDALVAPTAMVELPAQRRPRIKELVAAVSRDYAELIAC